MTNGNERHEDDAVTLTEAQNKLGEFVTRVQHGGERIGIMRYGKLAAVLMPVADYEGIVALERAQRRDPVADRRANAPSR